MAGCAHFATIKPIHELEMHHRSITRRRNREVSLTQSPTGTATFSTASTTITPKKKPRLACRGFLFASRRTLPLACSN